MPNDMPTEFLDSNDDETITRKSTELTVSPSPFPEFPEYIMNEIEEFEQDALHLINIYDELAQVEDYLMNDEKNEVYLPSYSELEVENAKLKQLTRYLINEIHSLADGNAILVFMIFLLLLLMFTISSRCRSKNHVHTASNTISTTNETIKV
jgi:hypothetical protein